MQVQRPIILLVENNDADVFMVRRALAAVGFSGSLRLVNSATEARSYLTNSGDYADPAYNACPDLIVCDYDLHGANALDLLSWLRLQRRLAMVPVVMLSSSCPPSDREQMLVLGARACYAKSGDIVEMTDSIRGMLGNLSRGSTGVSINALKLMHDGLGGAA